MQIVAFKRARQEVVGESEREGGREGGKENYIVGMNTGSGEGMLEDGMSGRGLLGKLWVQISACQMDRATASPA